METPYDRANGMIHLKNRKMKHSSLPGFSLTSLLCVNIVEADIQALVVV